MSGSTAANAARTSCSESGPRVANSTAPPSVSTRATSPNSAVRPAPGQHEVREHELGAVGAQRQALGIAAEHGHGARRVRGGAAQHPRARVDGEHARGGIARSERVRAARGAAAEIDDQLRRQPHEVEAGEQPRAGFVVNETTGVEIACAVERAPRGPLLGQRVVEA